MPRIASGTISTVPRGRGWPSSVTTHVTGAVEGNLGAPLQPVVSRAPASRTRPSIPVQLGEKEAQGVYSNLVLITHSSSEFILDFAKMLPGLQKATVQSRVIMTPQHVKMLLKALEENLAKFEAKHGAVKLPDKADEAKEIGFRAPDGSSADKTEA